MLIFWREKNPFWFQEAFLAFQVMSNIDVFVNVLNYRNYQNDQILQLFVFDLVLIIPAVWCSILLSSDFRLLICYKAKISFLDWLCHCWGQQSPFVPQFGSRGV